MSEWTKSKLIFTILLLGIASVVFMFAYGIKYASIPKYSVTGFISIFGGAFAIAGTIFHFKGDYEKGGKLVFVGGVLAFVSFLELVSSIIAENPILIFGMPVILVESALQNGLFFKFGVVGMISALTGGFLGIVFAHSRKPSFASYFTILLILIVSASFFGATLAHFNFPYFSGVGLVLFFAYVVSVGLASQVLYLPIRASQVLNQIKEKWAEKCPICKKETIFELKGFSKTVLVCNSCSAEWSILTSWGKSTVKKLMLRKSAASGKGYSLLRKFYPLIFWRTVDLENEPLRALQVPLAKGVNSKTVRLLAESVLYPDQRIIYVGKGQIISADSVKQGVICITNRTLTLYQPKFRRAYDYNLTEVENFSLKKGFFSSSIEIYMSKSIKVVIRGIHKGQEENVVRILKGLWRRGGNLRKARRPRVFSVTV